MQLPEMLHERSTASKSCGRSTFVPGREIFQIFPTGGLCKREVRARREERKWIERMNNLSIHISIPPSEPHLRASNPSRQHGESFKRHLTAIGTSTPLRQSWPAGTARNRNRVCFACPVFGRTPPGRPPNALGATLGDRVRLGVALGQTGAGFAPRGQGTRLRRR